MRDAKNKGRLNVEAQFQKGEDSKYAKLTWKQVREIRKRWRERTMDQKQLALIYNVDRATISMIVRNKTWVDDPQQ